MKKLFFLLAILFSISAFTQELSEGLKAKNDGNEAYRNKDYVSAITNWEKYMASGEEGVKDDINTQNLYISCFKYAATEFLKNQDYQSAFNYLLKYLEKGGEEAAKDGKTAYYIAYAANKMNKNDVALIYYQKSLDLDYKPDMCKLYMASIYKDAGDEAKMKEILIAAMEQYPDSKYLDKMASMLTIPMLKEAAEPFNQANELAKKASSGNPTEYVSIMTQACDKFQISIPLFEKVLKYDPKNEQAITYLKACNENIKAFNDYKASLIKK